MAKLTLVFCGEWLPLSGLELQAANDKTLVFVTESIENISAGWRARESYRILNNDEFVEVFELAGPGKEFEVYAENRFKRKK